MNGLNEPRPPSWSAIDGWAPPSDAIPEWSALHPWIRSLDAIGAEARVKLFELRVRGDFELVDLGGDPSCVDWSEFRPLRRDREEDWSDWLAQLIADSTQLGFASRLFGESEGRSRESYRVRRVRRELAVEDRRADLVIEWTDGRYTHVEVKVGDPHLHKTPDTARKVARAMQGHCRHGGRDFLLLLPAQVEDWHAQRLLDPACDAIHVITWIDVSRALRASLRPGAGESTRWRVWAHALSGAIEAELLGLPFGRTPDVWCRRLSVPVLRTALALLDSEGERRR